MSETGTSCHVPKQFVHVEQVNLMIDFMGQHADFAAGKLRSLEARQTSKALWEKLAGMLNDCNGGVKKTADGWSKYWSDWKNKLKNRTQLAKKRGAHVVRLTKLEKRALVILGPGFNKKRKVFVNGTGSYETSYSNDPPPIIKLEACQDDDSTNLSCEERTSDENSESNNDDVDDAEQNANNDILNNIYPKWLIEVEKKRADAELSRARAEEQSAGAASRAAEAALVQADALKKLAEATSNQAEALMRIALVLEARGERDVLAI